MATTQKSVTTKITSFRPTKAGDLLIHTAEGRMVLLTSAQYDMYVKVIGKPVIGDSIAIRDCSHVATGEVSEEFALLA